MIAPDFDKTSRSPGRARPAAQYIEPALTRLTVAECRRRFLLQSTGDEVELDLTGAPDVVCSVSDSNGAVVRTVHAWLSYLGRQVGLTYSANTVPQYGKTMTYLVRWIEKHPPLKNLSVDNNIVVLNRDDIVNWLNYMKERGAASAKTLLSREVCLHEFLDWLCTKDAGNLRDADNSPRGRDGKSGNITKASSPKSPKFIATETVTAVLNGLHNENERCMFHAQYDMGLRITELISLTRSELPDERHYESAYEFIPICINGVKGRGGSIKERSTLISRAVLRRIRSYHNGLDYKLAPGWGISDPKKPVFLTVNQKRWGLRNATKQFKAAVIRAGLPPAFRSHWLRHGTAFSVLRSDAGKCYEDRMLIAQQMLGHRDLKTTEIYTQIPPQILDELTKTGRRLNRLEIGRAHV